MEETIEKLLKKSQDGDKEALKQVIEYYKNNDDEEMADYFESKLKEILELEAAKEDGATHEDTVEEDDAGIKEATSSESEDIKEEVKEKDNEPEEETKDVEVEPEVSDNKPQNEAKFVSYDKLSIAELKEKVDNGDPMACETLAQKYLFNGQTKKAIELFNSAIDIFKDECENCTERELLSFFNCYYGLSICYQNDQDLAFLYLQNAAEVPCTEKFKTFVYFNLAMKCKNYKNDRQAYEKYLSKAAKLDKLFCLKAAICYQTENNKIDYEDFLERAKKMEAIEDNAGLYNHLDPIIEFKTKYKDNALTDNYCIDFVKGNNVCYVREFSLFTVAEFNALIDTISLLCSNYDKSLTPSQKDVDLFNICLKLLDEKENYPDFYKDIDFTEIRNYFLNFFMVQIENDVLVWKISKRMYEEVRPVLIENEKVNVLNKIKEKCVKDNPELEKLVNSDIEGIYLNAKKKKEEEENRRRYEEERRRKEEQYRLQEQEKYKKIIKYVAIVLLVLFILAGSLEEKVIKIAITAIVAWIYICIKKNKN